ncbi:MAG: Ig-like domain-containing protein [Propionibacteriaceae bacterium]|nr:Ig-like domain-containing protein [Propionibacteriaceae bacterium]
MGWSVKMKRRIALAVSSTLVTGLVAVAVLNPGVAATDVDLNDGGVWVLNGNDRIVGHLNYPALTLDAGIRYSASELTLFQQGKDVFVRDEASLNLAQVDVANAALPNGADIKVGTDVQVSGKRVGVVDARSGKAWLLAAEDVQNLSDESVPTIEGVDKPVMAMGVQGDLAVVSQASGEVVTAKQSGAQLDIARATRQPLANQDGVQLTMVGREPVALTSGGELVLPGGAAVQLSGSALRLQEPGPAAAEVLVATDRSLLRVPLSGGEPVVVGAPQPGEPVAPVMHHGCAYAAWAEASWFLRDCAGEDHDYALEVPGVKSAAGMKFRVNRDVIVLNDMANGGVWLPDQRMIQVDNWEQIKEELKRKDQQQDQTAQIIDEPQQERPQNEKNHPPVAHDDSFGIRPGRSTLLPVIMNDSDEDGDVLVAAPVNQPSAGSVVPVRNGAALQIAAPSSATGGLSFTYEINDGRGGTAQANVTLTVVPLDQNSGPVQQRTTTASIGAKGTMTVNLINDWIDPDGDPIYLKSASSSDALSVDTRPDGRLIVTDLGKGSARHELTVVVSDGQKDTEGKVVIHVRDGGNLKPVANGDHIVVQAGHSVNVNPLSNDTDPNGDQLRLVAVGTPPSGLEVTSTDLTAGSVTLKGAAAGTYNLTYQVTDGPAQVEGVIRVDVVEADTDQPPVAEDDIGLLPSGGQTLIEVLANDSDPNGGVLAVQSVELPEGSPLRVALIEHNLLRVTAPGGLEQPASFSYFVSNGKASRSARVMVLPVPAPSRNALLELTDDSLVVRSGDVGSVKVLTNDRSVLGLRMQVLNNLQASIKDEVGQVFLSNNEVRFRAGKRAGSGRIIYTVQDTQGNVASAYVDVTVTPADDDSNQAPRPPELVARTFAGSQVRIPVELNGIDPDGDSVVLLGSGGSPRLGNVEVKDGQLVYTAEANLSGTDTFTYVVQDRRGRRAEGPVRVGVVPRPEANRAPIATADAIWVRPGKKVAIPVLANDVDPDGDKLRVAEDSLASQHVSDLSLREGIYVVLTAPEAPDTYLVNYDVTDSVLKDTGQITVRVGPEAPLAPPIAVDDAVAESEVQGKDEITIPVLKNDTDPDGDIAEAKLTSSDPGVRVNPDKTLTIPVTTEVQLILYTVTDTDGQQASAVVRVPPSNQARPHYDLSTGTIKAKVGVTTTARINDYIKSGSGRQVRITDDAKVTMGVGWDGSNLVKDQLTLEFTPAKGAPRRTSISLEVTDGVDLNDPEGQINQVVLPVEIEPADNRPPVFQGAEIQVAKGEDASTLDVSRLVQDPEGVNPSEMTFALVSAPDGLDVSLSGTQLSVRADVGAALGGAGAAEVRVTDGDQQVSATFPIVVVPSTRGKIQTTPLDITTNAGKTETVDITRYATNPFPDRPLTVTAVEAPAEMVSASASGTTVTMVMREGVHGSAVVRYRVQDATKDANREVEGTITLTIRDIPGPPTGLRAVTGSVRGEVTLEWTAGPANGANITKFTAYDKTQKDSKACEIGSKCVWSGRKTGQEHTFEVTATNEVGESAPSAQASVMVDIEPEQPAPPRVQPLDRKVRVTWAEPVNEGTPITAYYLRLSPGGDEIQVPAGTLTRELPATNGIAHTVTVQAENSHGRSKVSLPSQPATPYGKPGRVTGLSAQTTNLGTAAGAGVVRVTWTAPDSNGRPIEQYTVTWPGGSKTVGGTATSTTVENVAWSTSEVKFTVTATNDLKQAGTHTSEPASASVWVVGQPARPTVGSVSATGENNQVRVSGLGGGAAAGWSASDLRYEFNVDGGGWRAMPGNGVITDGALTNGTNHTLGFRAVGRKGAEVQATSPVTTAGGVNPFGPPTPPSVNCSSWNYGAGCSWSIGSGNGRPATTYVSESAGGGSPVSSNGKAEVGEGKSITRCVRVVQTSSELGERSSSWICQSATAPVKPPPPPPPPPPPAPPTYQPYQSNRVCRSLGCPKLNAGFGYWTSIRFRNMAGQAVTCRGSSSPAYITVPDSNDWTWHGEHFYSNMGSGAGYVPSYDPYNWVNCSPGTKSRG